MVSHGVRVRVEVRNMVRVEYCVRLRLGTFHRCGSVAIVP